jgi:hypothetical protein
LLFLILIIRSIPNYLNSFVVNHFVCTSRKCNKNLVAIEDRIWRCVSSDGIIDL